MSQTKAKSKCPPPNRIFQRTNIASFTEARRHRFLSLRKQNRELYFEKARKIALNADVAHHKQPQAFAYSQPINAFTQYPPNDNGSMQIEATEHDPSNDNNTQAQAQSHKKKRKKKKKKHTKDSQQSRKQKLLLAREARMKYVQMLMVHEWMIDIPHDLAQNWLVGLRVEGERCLVFIHGGRTISRNRTGNFIHNRFPSALPAGNYTQQKKSGVTILDCIWIANISTYYVIDCILWQDQKIGLSDASMRLWFFRSKLEECKGIETRSKYNKYRFVAIETMDVSVDNLQYLYQGRTLVKDEEEEKEKKQASEMHSDGLIFYHKHGCYVQSVSCPLILIWKDSIISRWFVDTSNRQNKNKLLQFVSLQLQSNTTVTTLEEDVVLGQMTQENIEKYHFKPNELLRFSITNAICDEEQCKVDNLLYVKRCSTSKMLPDSWSKIVFQHQAKHGISVRFEDIVHVSREWEMKQMNGGIDSNENTENVDDELRIATLGLSNFHF